MDRRILYILLAIIIGVNGNSYSQTEIRSVSPFGPLKYTLKTKGTDKEAMLKKIDEGNNMPIYSTFAKENVLNNYLLLDGETGSYSMEICNNGTKEMTYSLSTNLPQNWNVVMRRQAFLTDFYSHQQKNNPNINFYGDALPKLMQPQPGKWNIAVKPKEVARIFVEYNAIKSSLGNLKQIEFSVFNGANVVDVKKVPIVVSAKTIPNVAFNSVVFNNNTYQIASFANELVKTGFTHQIAYTPPSAIFDKAGNLVGDINQTTANSKQFRYVTDYWLKRGKSILFYWNAHAEKLAPLANKTYLKPYSAEWNKAYVALVKKAYEEIRKRIPSVKPNQIFLYVQDEISSGKYAAKASAKVIDIQSLLKVIKKEIPEFKTFLTLGLYTYPVDLQAVLPYTDISVSHMFMPDKLNRNAPASYNPAKAFQQNLYTKFSDVNTARIQQLKVGKRLISQSNNSTGSSEIWSYLVTQGKTTNILNFRALPIYATLLGRDGLSWWAFSNTKGSSWLANDQNSLDYSMIYNKEVNNPIYKYWCKDNSETIIPSIRLYGARAGIQDAKILKYITQNLSKLSANQLKDFQTIINKLSVSVDSLGIQPNESEYLTAEEYETISQRLRNIYISI